MWAPKGAALGYDGGGPRPDCGGCRYAWPRKPRGTRLKGGFQDSPGQRPGFLYNAVRDPVHIRDLNATLLHLMGIDHRRLSYSFQGLDQRLTGTEEANPVQGILA